MLEALEGLGLNVYPTEEARTGPALLETLADVAERLADGAHVRNALPAGGFDVILGQVRHGWRHLDPEGDLPTQFVIRTKPRTLTVRTAEKLKDVYLPDHGWKTRLLREHGQPIVAMRAEEASKKPLRDRLVELGARRAAGRWRNTAGSTMARVPKPWTGRKHSTRRAWAGFRSSCSPFTRMEAATRRDPRPRRGAKPPPDFAVPASANAPPLRWSFWTRDGESRKASRERTGSLRIASSSCTGTLRKADGTRRSPPHPRPFSTARIC